MAAPSIANSMSGRNRTIPRPAEGQGCKRPIIFVARVSGRAGDSDYSHTRTRTHALTHGPSTVYAPRLSESQKRSNFYPLNFSRS